MASYDHHQHQQQQQQQVIVDPYSFPDPPCYVTPLQRTVPRRARSTYTLSSNLTSSLFTPTFTTNNNNNNPNHNQTHHHHSQSSLSRFSQKLFRRPSTSRSTSPDSILTPPEETLPTLPIFKRSRSQTKLRTHHKSKDHNTNKSSKSFHLIKPPQIDPTIIQMDDESAENLTSDPTTPRNHTPSVLSSYSFNTPITPGTPIEKPEFQTEYARQLFRDATKETHEELSAEAMGDEQEKLVHHDTKSPSRYRSDSNFSMTTTSPVSTQEQHEPPTPSLHKSRSSLFHHSRTLSNMSSNSVTPSLTFNPFSKLGDFRSTFRKKDHGNKDGTVRKATRVVADVPSAAATTTSGNQLCATPPTRPPRIPSAIIHDFKLHDPIMNTKQWGLPQSSNMVNERQPSPTQPPSLNGTRNLSRTMSLKNMSSSARVPLSLCQQNTHAQVPSSTPPNRMLSRVKVSTDRQLSQKHSFSSLNTNENDPLVHQDQGTVTRPMRARRAPCQAPESDSMHPQPSTQDSMTRVDVDPQLCPSSAMPIERQRINSGPESLQTFPLTSISRQQQRQCSPIIHEAANDVRRNMAREVINSTHLASRPSHQRPYPATSMDSNLRSSSRQAYNHHPNNHDAFEGQSQYTELGHLYQSNEYHLDGMHSTQQQHSQRRPELRTSRSMYPPTRYPDNLSQFQAPSLGPNYLHNDYQNPDPEQRHHDARFQTPLLQHKHLRQLSTGVISSLQPRRMENGNGRVNGPQPLRAQTSLGMYPHARNQAVSDGEEEAGAEAADERSDENEYRLASHHHAPQSFQSSSRLPSASARHFYVHEDADLKPNSKSSMPATIQQQIRQPIRKPPSPSNGSTSPDSNSSIPRQPFPQHASSSSDSQQQKAPAKATKDKIIFVNEVAYVRQCAIGKGGSSKVYRAHLRDNGVKQVALKVVYLEKADQNSYLSFCNEMDLLKKLTGHERIIHLEDSQLDNDKKRLYLVMELGETDLNQLLNRQAGKAISFRFIKHIWEQMLEAVHAVHEAGIIHTDLKPANFVLVQGAVKIIDFGIAKAVPADTTNISRENQIGTANYMSPEALSLQVISSEDGSEEKRVKMGRATDVWALGCILYQMVYGRTPFSTLETSLKICTIRDPKHYIDYAESVTPVTIKINKNGERVKVVDEGSRVIVEPEAIETMKACLRFKKEDRASIPQLLNDRFLVGKDGIWFNQEGKEETISMNEKIFNSLINKAWEWKSTKGINATDAQKKRFINGLKESVMNAQ